MRLLPLLIVFLTLPLYAQTGSGRVIEIVDGENLIVSTKSNDRSKVRIAGIDAPE